MAVAPRPRPLRAQAVDRAAEDGLRGADRRLAAGPVARLGGCLLAPARLKSDGLVRVEPVRRAWAEHLEGSRNWQYPLWTVLMLQAWRERWA